MLLPRKSNGIGQCASSNGFLNRCTTSICIAIKSETNVNAKTVDILKKAAAIFEGRHSALGGDRIANTIGFLHNLGRDSPGQAAAVADDMEKDADRASDCCGLHPDRVRWCASCIREGIKARNTIIEIQRETNLIQ